MGALYHLKQRLVDFANVVQQNLNRSDTVPSSKVLYDETTEIKESLSTNVVRLDVSQNLSVSEQGRARGNINAADAGTVSNLKTVVEKYDGLLYTIKITDVATTMWDVTSELENVSSAGDNVVFDVSTLNAGMYLCTVYLKSGYYRIADLVTGFVGTGFYSNSDLLADIIKSGSQSSGKHYTMRWDKVENVGVRLNDAASITADTSNFGHFGSVNPDYSNPFDNIYPWSGRKLCNIDMDLYRGLTSEDDITDCVTAWEDDVNFDYDDQYGVWVYTPPFFGRSYELGDYRYFDVTDENLLDNIAYPATINGRWHGCDVTLTVDGTSKHCNLPTTGMPMANVSLQDQHNYAQNYDASLVDIYDLDASTLLYLVEYCDMNSQSAIGNGVSDLFQESIRPLAAVSNSDTIQLTANVKLIAGAIIDIGTTGGSNNIARTHIVSVSGTTVTLADAVTCDTSSYVSIHGLINIADADIGSKTGYIGTNGRSNVYYRGEVLYGNKYQYVLGAYRQTRTNHLWIADRGDTDNYNALNTSKHTDTGLKLPEVTSSSWQSIKTIGLADGLSAPPFMTEAGGTSAKPVGDSQYVPLPTAGDTVCLSGGNADDGLHVGVFCVVWNSTASNSNWARSSRPSLKNPAFRSA